MNRSNNFVFLIVLCIICTGCPSKDVISESISVGEDVQDWMSYFLQYDRLDSITYNNGGVAKLTELLNSSDSFPSDCQVNNVTRQCQYGTLTLEFVSPFEDSLYYVTLYLFPVNRLTVNYSITSVLGPEIFRLDLDEGLLEVPQDAFSVVNTVNYNYNGEVIDAIVVNTLSTETLFASLPPKKFVLSKEYGVIEWEDYSNNLFILEQ